MTDPATLRINTLEARLWSIAHAAGIETKRDLQAAALDALTAPPVAGGVRVRPLEWRPTPVFQGCYMARCPLLELTYFAEGDADRGKIEARRAAKIMAVIQIGPEGGAV